MFRNDPDKDWERFGAEDPYYSVINAEEYRSARLTDARLEDLLRTGESTVAYFLHFIEQRVGGLPSTSALGFGCGVGRLLIPLARRFARVTGVDVSQSMLAEAAKNLDRAGAENAELLLSDDELSRVQGHFDFVLSYLVLQHVPVSRGDQIIHGLLSRVAPGGIAAIHVTVARTTPGWRQLIHVARRNFLPLHVLGNVATGMHWKEPLIQSNLYDLDRVRELGVGEGFDEIYELPVRHADHVGVMVILQRGAEATGPAEVAIR